MAVAKNADVIILAMGLNQEIEKEGIDRSDIALPGNQSLLASAICKMGKPTVLVLINGGIIGIDNLKDECPAILEVWYPGFRGAEAIADTLFGVNNPGGKLPVTVYWSNFTNFTDWHSMDITAPPFGRTYRYYSGPELFPFGYGLSFTQFKLQFVNCSSTTSIQSFCVEITNKGNMSGHETVFIFVVTEFADIPSDEPASKMKRKLVEFEKVFLEIGESAVVEWNADNFKDIALFNVSGQQRVFPGLYRVQFSNGVDENLFVDVNVTVPPHSDLYQFQFQNGMDQNVVIQVDKSEIMTLPESVSIESGTDRMESGQSPSVCKANQLTSNFSAFGRLSWWMVMAGICVFCFIAVIGTVAYRYRKKKKIQKFELFDLNQCAESMIDSQDRSNDS